MELCTSHMHTYFKSDTTPKKFDFRIVIINMLDKYCSIQKALSVKVNFLNCVAFEICVRHAYYKSI